MGRSILLTLAITVAFGGASANAQENNVSLGQVGDTNTIRIDQVGVNNLVGGESELLRLNQIGDLNAVTILQVGENNEIGRRNNLGQFGTLTGQAGQATGLFQRGERNVLDIEQRTMRGGGSNLVGAIDQTALAFAPSGDAPNIAIVRQTGGVYDPASSLLGESTGAGGHAIGEISQVFDPSRGGTGTNRLSALQAGFFQRVEQIRQSGAGNAVDLTQTGSDNSLRLAFQEGAANTARLVLEGSLNTMGNVRQMGSANATVLEVKGDGNLVDQIVQSSLSTGGGRNNTASISIVGNDNGGEGIGGFGAMSSQGALVTGFAASVEQYGDGNGLTLTIGSATGRADGNLFSVSQTGLDNDSAVVQTGDANEFAVRQLGDRNVFDLVQASGSVAGASGQFAFVEQAGDDNAFDAGQSGLGNRLIVTTTGDDNTGRSVQEGERNTIRFSATGNGNTTSTARATGLLPTATLLPDGLVQRGARNSMDVAIGRLFTSNDNVVAVLQDGLANLATVLVDGSGNRGTMSQTGDDNIAFIQQNGSGNVTSIVQD